MASVETKKKGRDFYEILGVERSANQGKIKQSYRKLAVKYHPDKNPGDEEAAEKFKEISTAYAVLSDPNKKRQYDIHGEDGTLAELGSLNVEELGTVGRLFGALISKAGIPVPTEITQKIITAAGHIAKGRTDVPGFDVPHVENLMWGETVGDTVARQDARFYRIDVTEADLKNGVIVTAKSSGHDKFKLVFFDDEGQVTMVQESRKLHKGSQASLYIVPFGRYDMIEAMPLSMMKHLDEDLHPVFMILDTYDKDHKTHLLPGSHLFCVYGDNWFQGVKFTLQCVVAIPPDSEPVQTIASTEKKLAAKKKELEEFQPEFAEIKKKYDEAIKRLQGDVEDVAGLMGERDAAYGTYMDESSSKYGNLAVAKNKQKEQNGYFGKFFG